MAAAPRPAPASAPAVLVLNHFPNGLDFSDTKVHTYGRMVFNASSSYATNGVPFAIIGPFTAAGATLQFESAPVYSTNPFIHGDAYSTTSGINYIMDPDNQTIRIFSAGIEMSSGSSLGPDMPLVHLVSNRTPDIPLGSGLPVLII